MAEQLGMQELKELIEPFATPPEPPTPPLAPGTCVQQYYLISHKVFIKSFCKSQFPQRYVNLSFIIANIKNKLKNLCGN